MPSYFIVVMDHLMYGDISGTDSFWKADEFHFTLIDLNNGRILATASTVEHSVNNTLECDRSCNAKAAAVVPKVLAMRLKVEGVKQGRGRGIHVDVNKEVEKKGFKNHTKVCAIVNALTRNGVKLILDDAENGNSRPSY
ncbi:hypothetical protein Vadar_021188 [Vaccinium darrowii]|uniref:Uncharacterized protein n=1 Tax=Vaccinium darrowii TaxID=229202 RepID=A0ACB7XBM9_9ERIC|nr:hypothetical protein Vadar_021188 [Vaccinium darrowii]